MTPAAKSHPIWSYFEKTDGANRSSCTKCCVQITSPNSGTTNLCQHLHRVHLSLHNLYSEKKDNFEQQKTKLREKPNMILNYPKVTNFAHVPVFAGNDPGQTSVIRALAEMLAIDIEPLSKVKHRWFRNLLNKLQPRYKIPSRTTFSRSLASGKFERE